MHLDDQDRDLAPGGATPDHDHQPQAQHDDGPPCRTCMVEHLGCPCVEAVPIEPEGDEDGPF